MFEAIIWFLIYVCAAAGAVYAVIWVLRDILELPIPGKLIQIMWAVFVLLVLLFLVRLILPLAGGRRFGELVGVLLT